MNKIGIAIEKIGRKVKGAAKKTIRKDDYLRQKQAAEKNTAAVTAAGAALKQPSLVPESERLIGKSNTIEALDTKLCTGCGACAAKCLSKAVVMSFDNEGFMRPAIDNALCTGCGLCKSVCPVINPRFDNNEQAICKAAMAAADERMQSSSGGIFPLLAKSVIADGGYVCGAVFTDSFSVRHEIVSNIEGLQRMRGSKYVQSDCSKVYSEIKELLDSGKTVLFSGCPCQVAAVKALSGNPANLISVDLLCHGVPSQKMLDYYIDTHYDRSSIAAIGFRDKDYFGWSSDVTVTMKDGSVIRTPGALDDYYRAFSAGLISRPSCDGCMFARLPRQGDITLGDFWGVEKYDPELTDGKGTSVVSINSEKGERRWDKIKGRLVLDKRIEADYLKGTGQPYAKPQKAPQGRKLYLQYTDDGATMEKAYDYSTRRKFDVGIVGIWYGCNYGSVATYYALHELIRSFGLSVLMIDAPGSSAKPLPDNHARRFAAARYEIAKRRPLKDYKAFNNHADTFIIGSDQVWNRCVSKTYNLAFYFDFVDDNHKKIAYGASFGHDKDFASVNERRVISHYMNRFDGIGVRESSGVDICRECYNAEAVRVLDPVFAVDRKSFDALVDIADKRRSGSGFLTAYILDPDDAKKRAIQYVCEALGLTPVIILDGQPDPEGKNAKAMDMDGYIAENVETEDWLWYIKNSDFVITDSCHGASFSIIFERQFIAIANAKRGTSRFDSLLDVFGLKDRCVMDAAKITKDKSLLQPIDYKAVGEILATEREKSLSWLKEKLFAPKVFRSSCAYPIVDERCK